MIDVDALPAAPPSSPARDPAVPWLIGAACILLLDALLPWERWCSEGTAHLPERCFTARAWSGSAALLGMVSIAAALAFLVATIGKGLRAAPGAPRLALFSGLCSAATAKAVVVLYDAGRTTSGQTGGSPASFGAWIGLAAVGLGWVALGSAGWRRAPRGRVVAAVAAVAVAVAAVAVPYARSGLAWWGGPLALPELLGAGSGSGLLIKPHEPLLTHGIFVFNEAPADVTLDSLELLEATPPIRVLATYVIAPTPCAPDAVEPSEVPELSRSECAYPLAGYRLRPGGAEDAVSLVALVQIPSPGVYRSGWFRITYRAGPLRFEMFRTDELVLCAPEPGKRSCPDAGF